MLRVDGFQIRMLLPPREHCPAHVHIVIANEEIVVNLGPVALREVYGMKPANIIKAIRIV